MRIFITEYKDQNTGILVHDKTWTHDTDVDEPMWDEGSLVGTFINDAAGVASLSEDVTVGQTMTLETVASKNGEIHRSRTVYQIAAE